MEHEPCVMASPALHWVIGSVTALNLLLSTWLAHRRFVLDLEIRRRRNGGNQQSGSAMTQERIDGGPTDGPRA
jgi:hypothetical protein